MKTVSGGHITEAELKQMTMKQNAFDVPENDPETADRVEGLGMSSRVREQAPIIDSGAAVTQIEGSKGAKEAATGDKDLVLTNFLVEKIRKQKEQQKEERRKIKEKEEKREREIAERERWRRERDQRRNRSRDRDERRHRDGGRRRSRSRSRSRERSRSHFERSRR